MAVLLLLLGCNPVVTSDPSEAGRDQVLNATHKHMGEEVSLQSQVGRDNVESGQITGVDIERLFSLLQAERVLLVDCRPQLYYRLGHIDSAINLPYKKYEVSLEKIMKRLDQGLAERKVIVLYCQNYNCPDAYLFAKKIAEKGYSTSVYKGGWQEWKASGL